MSELLTPENIKMLLVGLIVVMIMFFLVKYAVKVAMAIVAILIIFQVGFMMTGTDLVEKFQLKEFIGEEKAHIVEVIGNDLEKRRTEKGIVDRQAVYDKVLVGGTEKAVEIAKDALSDIDYMAFAEELANAIYEEGKEVDLDALSVKLHSQLENVSEEDVNNMIDKIQEILSEKEASEN